MHHALRRLAERALARWSTTARVGRRLSHGENTIYAVDGQPWVLRLHRDDYHPTAGIESELAVLDGLREAGFRVGRPQSMPCGDRVLTLDGRRITVLEHVPGRHAIRRLGRGRARVLGATLRALQDWSLTWQPPERFQRPVWDRAGLYGDRALWSSMEEAGVDPVRAAALRAHLDDELSMLDDDLRLLHHDLHRGNIVWDGRSPGLIDFDDCGFGYPLVDLQIATQRLPPALREEVYEGYGGLTERQRALLPTIELALKARAVGWLHSRSDLTFLADRLPRIVRELEDAADALP